MCGRYTGFIDDSQELLDIYTTAKSLYPNVNFRSGEIFPTETVPLLMANGDIISPIPAIWGFPGFKGNDVIINARAETATEKRTFADSFKYRRCIIPTTGYYEWSHSGAKKKYLFRLPDKTILYLAGLYYEYSVGVRFVVLTTQANYSTSDIHHRMPVILKENELISWTQDIYFANEHITKQMPTMIKCEA